MNTRRSTRRPPSANKGPRWPDIVDAATAEFREFGYDGATVRGIADRVGLLKGSLYNYINGKEDLFLAVVQEPATQFIEALRAMSESDEPATEKLRQLMTIQVAIFSKHFPAPFVYLARAKSRVDERFDKWDDEYILALEELLRRGVSDGEFRDDIDIEMTTRAIIGMMAWMLAWYEPRTPQDDERIVNAFWGLVTRGLVVAEE